MRDKIALKTLNSQEWETPKKLFDILSDEFHFTLDPCATKNNAKCSDYFTIEDNGLNKVWSGNVFVNPPFKDVSKWASKSFNEVKENHANCVVMLVAVRTDTKWFHEIVLPYARIIFLKGRLKYSNAKNPCPFPIMVIVFKWGDLTIHYPETLVIK
jgi:site-specific DNA-methyltransferase (adenine-specific)